MISPLFCDLVQFFKVSDEAIIDATKKGNMGRLINHSVRLLPHAALDWLT